MSTKKMSKTRIQRILEDKKFIYVLDWHSAESIVERTVVKEEKNWFLNENGGFSFKEDCFAIDERDTLVDIVREGERIREAMSKHTKAVESFRNSNGKELA